LDVILFQISAAAENLCAVMQNRVQNMKLLVKSFSAENLELRFRTIEQPLFQRFDDAKEDLLFSLQKRVDEAKNRIAFAKRILEDANPKSILARGYSVVSDAHTGEIIRKAAQTKNGQRLCITLSEGEIGADVIEKGIKTGEKA